MAELIKVYALREAHTSHLFGLMDSISERLKKEDIEQLHLTENVIAFDKALAEFGEAIRQKSKTVLTSKINQTDRVRCNIVRGLIHHLKGYALMPNAEEEMMAKQLLNVVKKYTNYIDLLPLREKTGVIDVITGSLQKENLKPLVQRLHLERVVADLIRVNDEFSGYYASRNEIRANYVVGLTLKRRQEMLSQFYELCRVINANALLYDEAPYRGLANIINVEIAKTREKIKARKSRAKER